MDRVKNDLIEFPRETLENEYKGWVNLDQNATRAKIARHLAALANHGGGHLIFGFQDNMTPDPNRPTSLDKYNRDTFTGIVKKYLYPHFQCEVDLVPNRTGDKFPVVRVPGHGRTPIITTSDGPHENKEKPQGIKKMTYYIRKPGPESAPISQPQEWNELIRRCTLNDREELLSDIARLFSSPEKPPVPDTQQLLHSWHQETEKRFLQLLSRNEHPRWPVKFDNRYQLGYMISLNGDEVISNLPQTLIEVNNKVLNTVNTGWGMFYPMSASEVAPRTIPENPDGTGKNILEADYTSIKILQFFNQRLWVPEFWRMAPDGRANLIRGYMEDRPYSNTTLGRPSGTWLSPETVIRETAELVTHAKELVKLFPAAQISFRCTWAGLENRRLADFNHYSDYFRCHESQADKRTTERTCSTVELEAKWSTVVSDLSEPVLSLFGFEYCSPEFVENMKPQFIKVK